MQRIYDTREGKKVDLQLREPGKVGIYACGVTVYDLCHVGHARTWSPST
jgi:cysteinyl-tRNA synthetase